MIKTAKTDSPKVDKELNRILGHIQDVAGRNVDFLPNLNQVDEGSIYYLKQSDGTRIQYKKVDGKWQVGAKSGGVANGSILPVTAFFFTSNDVVRGSITLSYLYQRTFLLAIAINTVEDFNANDKIQFFFNGVSIMDALPIITNNYSFMKFFNEPGSLTAVFTGLTGSGSGEIDVVALT